MIVVNELEQVAYSEKKIEKSPWLPDDRPTVPKVGVARTFEPSFFLTVKQRTIFFEAICTVKKKGFKII
jgi:hypothetical protein